LPDSGRRMAEETRGVREVENWLSPSQAGAMLGTSGQWVTRLARRRELDAVRTSLGWLINPADVERLANERLKRAEQKISTMKSARAAGVAGAGTRRAAVAGRVSEEPRMARKQRSSGKGKYRSVTTGRYVSKSYAQCHRKTTIKASRFADSFIERHPDTFHELSKR
jgi:hypothetical protein